MDSRYGPLVLLAVGALPGIVALVAAIQLWRGRRVLEANEIQKWSRIGYFYLGVFCIASVFVTKDVDADPMLIAFGWIGLPAFTSIFGLWVFAERQRMTLDEFPSPKRMHALSTENRQELRYITAELSNDLNRALGAAGSLQRGNAIGRALSQDAEDLAKVQQRLRSSLKRCNELDARYGLHLRKLRDAVENPEFERYPLDPAIERSLNTLQIAQHDIDAGLDKVIDHAVDCRATVNRVLQNITWS